ncbi:MAG: BACON domain-containing protein [Paramuribaculum sp.]|nr:BACON domain-containing protein [Paramuribaculum sp.]
MNKLILYIIAGALFLGLTGCKDDFDPNGNLEPSISAHWLSPSKTNFNNYLSSAFSENFSIESLETPWKFSDVPDWISLTPSTGNASASVTLWAQENNNANNSRTAIFYLQSNDPDWNYSRAMSVSQAKALPALSVEETALTFGGNASQQTINVTSNCTWSASCLDSWVALSPDVTSGKLNISVSANLQDTYRSSTIYLSYGSGYSTSLKITQSPAGIISSADTLLYENVASKYDVTIDSEADWSSNVSESWIIVTPDNGKAGKTSVSIEVTPNPSISSRTGYVSFQIGTTERLQIVIQQRGIYIEADKSLTFSSIVESKQLSILSNTSWTVTGKPNWLNLSKETGEGKDVITVTTSDNPNTTSRIGEIVLSQVGLSIECKVKVTQLGKTLSTDVNLLELSDKEGQMTFNLISDAAWTSTHVGDWFTTSPTSGSGNATITVAAEENKTTEERTGTINYAYLDKNTSVNVHQLAKYMTIDNRTFEFDSKGGSHTIELSTNDEWTAEIEHNASWIKLSKSSGSGNTIITLTAEDNASVNTRSTAVVISTKSAQSIRILVSQKPRHLSVSTSSILFFANGGTSEVFAINTDGTYEIKSDAEWFTVNKGEGNTFTVQATKNSSKEMRRGKIAISLTGLKEGSLSLELTVVQAGEGNSSFIINGFTEDSDWNCIGGSLTVTIKGYTSDKNWDENVGATLTVKVIGFSTDNDWNKNDSSSCSVSINTYGADKDWNNPSNS